MVSDFAAGGCIAPRFGCGCSCHDPVMGQSVKHFAPCCYPEYEPTPAEVRDVIQRQRADRFERAVPPPKETR